MSTDRPRTRGVPHLLTLALGLAAGWGLAGSRAPTLRAHGGDRWEESILTSGATFARYNEGSKIQVTQDAIYYLDYRAGKLIGTVPTIRQSVGSTRILDGFAERDLVADFKIDLDTGPRPHFLMTTGSMSSGSSSSFGDGGADLYVFESTTKQVAVYRIEQRTVGTSSQPRLDLLEIRPFGAAPAEK